MNGRRLYHSLAISGLLALACGSSDGESVGSMDAGDRQDGGSREPGPDDTGGFAPDGIAATDRTAGDYRTRTRMIEPNSEMAVAAVGTKIYVLGGYPSTRTPVNTLQIYDSLTDRWNRGAPYPITIH